MSAAPVRACRPHDIAAIIDLERACPGAPQWGEAFWRGVFGDDVTLRGVFIAEIDAQVCGYSVASFTAGVAELECVVVSGKARGSGLGRALCERAMQWARELGATTIELEVRESNAAARGLYRRMEFVEQGRRAKYYSKPPEDAVLMAAKL